MRKKKTAAAVRDPGMNAGLREAIDAYWTRRVSEAIKDPKKPVTNDEWDKIMGLYERGILGAGAVAATHVNPEGDGGEKSAEELEAEAEAEGGRPLPTQSKWLKEHGGAQVRERPAPPKRPRGRPRKNPESQTSP